MKNFIQSIACFMLLFSSISTVAQKNLPVKEPDANRPSIFKKLPSRINCPISNLESLLEFPIGKKVNIQLAEDIQFQGVVSSLSSKSDHGIKSIVIRSANLQGAALTFSKITKEDGSIYFTGRMISFRHADVYEIAREKGQYVFIKKGFYDVINE